ncbi:uncharacterized protein LOC132274426 [Cornus florida]|uniref:uncharacterized protein LOC132274426 n=1 Tax=Cornus florida TaxID=4283 RepID=UPI00289E1C84|nr:uncharacterized protein LOC132274426 [Cornus florida]
MDREQEEMQFLGPFGICREAYKIIISWRKIFTKITLALILPLSFILLAHIKFSELLTSRIIHNQAMLGEAQIGTQRYNKLSPLISSEHTTYWLFQLGYIISLFIFSFLSTSAVVYTIACIYTGREVTFKKVMSVVPKVWKRLVLTFLSTVLAFFAYSLVFTIITILCAFLWAHTAGTASVSISLHTTVVIFFIILIIYGLGALYMIIIWQLASAVSVLEDSYGFKALVKSKNLIKGKMWVALIIFLMLNFSSFVIYTPFQKFVVHGESQSLLYKVGFGMLFLSLQSMLCLFGLIVQTVIYFVCKSYHHENINKSVLSDHLEVYHGEYAPLKKTDVPLGQFQV